MYRKIIRERLKIIGWYLLVLLPTDVIALQTDQAYQYVTRYDTEGRVVATISPDPDSQGPLGYLATRNTYSGKLLLRVDNGYLDTWLDETINPASNEWASHFHVAYSSRFSYDNWGRKITESAQDNAGITVSLVQFSYDDRGRIECKAVRMNPSAFNSLPSSACTLGTEGSYGPDRISKYTYNWHDRVLNEVRAFGTPLEQTYVTNTYVEELVLETVTDANGNLTKYIYDDHNRLEYMYFPSKYAGMGSESATDFEQYGYDKNGNRVYLRKRDGREFSFQYDSLNRMIYKNSPSTDKDVYYEYDLQGLQTYARFDSRNNIENSVSTSYTGFGELAAETVYHGSTPRTVSHQYDKNGNRTRTSYPDNPQNFVTYRYDGLDRVENIYERDDTQLYAYSYNQYGELWQSTTGGTVTTTRLYDGVGRLDLLDYDAFGSTYDLFIDFGLNPSGQIISQDLSNSHYYYNGDMGRTGIYFVNGLNQYTQIGGNALGYDDNGNMTSDTDRTYAYDAENRLVSVSGVGENAAFSYDPLGRLLKTTINGNTRWYLNSGDNLLAEYVGGAVTERYVHAANMGTPVAMYAGATMSESSLAYLHTNHQGSVIAYSNATGSIYQVNSYDEYGMTAESNQGRFGYNGQLYFGDLELYHYRARFYSPGLGRFLQTDPVGYKDQMNLYAYVHNDPVNFKDPTGKTCTMSDGKAQCKVDDPGKWSKKEIKRVNKAYTKAVNKLLKNPNKKIKVTVKNKSFETTAGKQAKLLSEAKVYAGVYSKTGRAHAAGGALRSDSESGGPEITINRNVLQDVPETFRITRTFVHESLHLNPDEKVMLDLWNSGPKQFNQDHRSPYNSAAGDLL